MAEQRWIIEVYEKSAKVGAHPNLLKVLRNKFTNMEFSVFSETFAASLMSIFITPTSIRNAAINNMIEFAARGLSMLLDHLTSDGRTGVNLLTVVLCLFSNYGCVSKKVIRFRFCLCLSHVLNFVTDLAPLPADQCKFLTRLLLDRLSDKTADVRMQAAVALDRLQTRDDCKGKILEKFVFHMIHDPSVDVRIAIIRKIDMGKCAVVEMLNTSLLEGDSNVRKEVFKRFLNYPFMNLLPGQRQILLEKGLTDLNEIIQTIVKDELLKHWVEDCHGDMLEFLKKLEVENEIVCEKTLYVIFESYYDSEVLDLANLYLDSHSRVISFDELTIEKVFLWKCLAKYLTTEKKIILARNQGYTDDDYYDVLLPDLVNFSDYIRNYYFNYNYTHNCEILLTQLLDLATTFTIDEVGAASFNRLCRDLILDQKTSSKLVRFIVKLLNLTLKNGRHILCYVKEILNEIQSQPVEVYSLIDKAGDNEVLGLKILNQTNSIEELLEFQSQFSEITKMEILILEKMKNRMKEISISLEEKELVNEVVINILKGFELIFQVQQLPKVGNEKSLLTDIIQHVVVGYLECSMVSLRMEAIHCLSPYLMLNVNAAKGYIITLCEELLKPMVNERLVLQILFELFMVYDLETFNLDTDLDNNILHFFTFENVLPFLIKSIDYEIDDSSFKTVTVQGFCNLLLFDKVKSINLITKLLIIWLRPLSPKTSNLYKCLTNFFTSYMFYIHSSSSTLAKCYVRVLKEIQDFDLIESLGIQMKKVNDIFINLTDGSAFHCEENAVNSHGELAGYILDYLGDNTPSYTDMLIDTLCKLKLIFDDELASTLGPKFTHIIKHFEDRKRLKYLNKIRDKFYEIVDDKLIFEPQASTSVSHEPGAIGGQGELISQEHQSSDEDDTEISFTKLDTINQSLDQQTENDLTSSLKLFKHLKITKHVMKP